MRRAKYEEIREWTRDAVEEALRDDDTNALLRAIIAVAMHDADWRYAQDLCVRLSTHHHSNVRGNAVLGFGHIARVHGQLERTVVQPIIEAALGDTDDYVSGQADAAADDTAMYLGWEYNRRDEA